MLKLSSNFIILKFGYSEKATKVCSSSTCQIKSGRWNKFLLPSQNIWTLNENHCYGQSCNLVLLPNLKFKSWMLSNKRSHIIEENANSSKFQCGFCPKLLKTQKKLRSHERIHTEEKQYPCGYCDKMFSQR